MSENKLKIQVASFERTATLTIEEHIVDIVMLVAGTQDPVNTDPNKHAANTKYWQSSTANLWSELQKLKPQFIDLNLSEKFFSWNGDNNEKERNIAAERLLDLITRLYLKPAKEGDTLKFEGKEVHLHLIGHSHGGNVINQFTELITDSEMLSKSEYPIEELPEKWAIKSITYLSTPFFREKHQLNHTKLHEDCKIINVHNDYDITQRFIADFSIENLEALIKNFDSYKFHKAIKRIELVLSSNVLEPVIDVLNPTSVINDSTEGVLIWERTSLLLKNLSDILQLVIVSVNSLKHGKIDYEKKEITDRLTELITWSRKAQEKLKKRVVSYQERRDHIDQKTSEEDSNWEKIKHNASRMGSAIADSVTDTFEFTDFRDDLSLYPLLKTLNKILFIKEGLEDSYLLGLLEGLFSEQYGVTESIDNTTWDPKEQLKDKIEPIDVSITEKDEYHLKGGSKQDFEKFVSGAEKSIENGNLREFLMRLVSQEISHEALNHYVLMWLGGAILVAEKADDEYDTLTQKYIDKYQDLLKEYGMNLVIEEQTKKTQEKKTKNAFTKESMAEFDIDLKSIDNLSKTEWEKIVEEERKAKEEKEKNSPPAPPKIGSLAHFATISHGLSHTQFWPEVEKGLRESFSSGKN